MDCLCLDRASSLIFLQAMQTRSSCPVFQTVIHVWRGWRRFPGSPQAYNVLLEVVDADLLACSMEYISTQPHAGNTSYNVSNGDVFRWSEVVCLHRSASSMLGSTCPQNHWVSRARPAFSHLMLIFVISCSCQTLLRVQWITHVAGDCVKRSLCSQVQARLNDGAYGQHACQKWLV